MDIISIVVAVLSALGLAQLAGTVKAHPTEAVIVASLAGLVADTALGQLRALVRGQWSTDRLAMTLTTRFVGPGPALVLKLAGAWLVAITGGYVAAAAAMTEPGMVAFWTAYNLPTSIAAGAALAASLAYYAAPLWRDARDKALGLGRDLIALLMHKPLEQLSASPPAYPAPPPLRSGGPSAMGSSRPG